jgi:hypothetical protein
LASPTRSCALYVRAESYQLPAIMIHRQQPCADGGSSDEGGRLGGFWLELGSARLQPRGALIRGRIGVRVDFSRRRIEVRVDFPHDRTKTSATNRAALIAGSGRAWSGPPRFYGQGVSLQA